MKKRFGPMITSLIWIFTASFVVFYPMLISIYVFLPLMIGFMGFVLIIGIEKLRVGYILVGLIYMINLEVNLSLPLFLIILTTLFFYLLIYPTLLILKECPICISFLAVIFIDLIYFILLLGYDFIFDESSIVLDQLLLYSLVADMLLALIL